MKNLNLKKTGPQEERGLFSKAVGYELYLLRKKRSLSGKELAEQLNISQQQVSRYERGICNITIDMLILMLRVLDMPINDFFGRALVRISFLRFESGHMINKSKLENAESLHSNLQFK